MYHVDIENKRLIPLTPANLAGMKLQERYDLQEWIEKTPAILGEELFIVQKELELSFGARLDLLAIDKSGKLVIIELKRDNSGRNVEWQAIRYASYISNFTEGDILEHCARYLDTNTDDAREQIQSFVEEDFDKLNESQRIILCAREFHSDVASAVLWLRDYGLDFSCVRIHPYLDASDRLFVSPEIIIPLPEAKDYIERKESKAKEKKERAPWSVFKYVQVGENKEQHRNWDDCVQYGYISAGQDFFSSKKLSTLQAGDRIFAYMSGFGYVGYGEVIAEPIPIAEFIPNGHGQRLLELPLKAINVGQNADNERTEYAAKILWFKTVSREDAKTFAGIYANPGIVTRMRNDKTVEFLQREFEVDKFGEPE